MSNSEERLVLVLVVLCIIFGGCVGYSIGDSQDEEELIENGCGEYNQTTGDFQYIKPIEEPTK